MVESPVNMQKTFCQAEVEARRRSREFDISESHYLLMEMVTQEPVLQYCFKAIQGTCLSQGVMLQKKGAHDQAKTHKPMPVATHPFLWFFFAVTCIVLFWQDPITRQWSTHATEDFQEHLNMYFVPFCENAIRMFYICGFVPWILRKTKGNVIPEVLPLGTFTWTTELLSHKRKRLEKREGSHPVAVSSYIPSVVRDSKMVQLQQGERESRQPAAGGRLGDARGSRRVKQDSAGTYVSYRVMVTDGGVDEDDVFIYTFTPAVYEVGTSSVLYSTVPSPLANLIIDYKNLRQGQIRRSYADAWNTQARLMTTNQSGARLPAQGDSSAAYMGMAGRQDRDITVASIAHRDMEHEAAMRESSIKDMLRTQTTCHNPLLYSLPNNTQSLVVQDLKPVEDVAFLLEKYTRDVALVMGIPPHFVVSKTNLQTSTASSSQVHLFDSVGVHLCKC